MKKFVTLFLVFFSIIFLSSCTTISKQLNLLSTYEDDNVSATIVVANEYVDLNIKNKTNSVITLSVEGSTTTLKNGETSKLIPKGTIYIQANAIQSPFSIAPLGVLNKSFAPASAIAWDNTNSTWGIKSWVNRDNFDLVFPYMIDGKQNFIVVQTSLTEKEGIIGTVDASKTYWHILFTESDKYHKYQGELYDMAFNEAVKLYGDGIKLVNGSYVGKWSPLSLALYFNILGYVDKVTFKADVQKIQ